MGKYRVVYERDETKAWTVSVPGVPGCFTWGRSLAQAKARAREALASHLDVSQSSLELDDDVRVAGAARAIQAALDARRCSTAAQAIAQKATAEAAQALVEAGLTMRDAATILGLSHQRIGQLVTG